MKQPHGFVEFVLMDFTIQALVDQPLQRLDTYRAGPVRAEEMG